MRTIVGARELKTRLGKYLRAVRSGATIVVTERGHPVAEIRPLEYARDVDEARRDALAALGVLSKGAGPPLRPFEPIKVRGGPLSRTVVEDREDRL